MAEFHGLKGCNSSYLGHGCTARKMSIMVGSCILHIVLMNKVSVVSMCSLGWGQGPCAPLVSTTLTAVTGSRAPRRLRSGSTVSQQKQNMDVDRRKAM